MFSLCRTPLAASTVDCSLSCRLLSASEECLVTAGADVLRVFRLRPHQGVQEVDYPDDSRPPKMRLECALSWRLHGTVQSIRAVRLNSGVGADGGNGGSGRDALVLSFLDAKLSVVEYDPDAHDLRTVSLHSFEDEETRGGYAGVHAPPLVRVDPENRCAAMLAYGRRVVVLPFRGERVAGMSDGIDDFDLPGGGGVGGAAGKEASSSAAAATASSPVLPSYILDLKSVITTNSVDNIVDIQFLHGYNQPTIMLLYEPLKTFSGRIAVRKDTCRLDVLTLDVKERISAFIWSKEMLPFDCVSALPVPRPIGGVLVLSANALHYLNQGIPPYAVSLNAVGDAALENINRQNDVKLTLDCAVAEFVTPERAVISLKGGELYVLSLLVDGMRSVRGFHFDRAAASVLTASLTVIADRYLFLGSRLGNSLLLQFTEKDIGHKYAANDSPPTKRKKTSSLDWTFGGGQGEDDLDLFEVYGGGHSASSGHSAGGRGSVGSYSFEVCDSLLNVGPCADVAMGEPAFLSEELAATTAAKADPDVELVATSGHGKNGALCVLQQSVRPQVVTTFELPGCKDMWTVVGGGGKPKSSTSSEISGGHDFLILSRPDSTMILQTGQEINELDKSGFCTDAPTVFTCNLGRSDLVVQVTARQARLLRGADLAQKVDLQRAQLRAPVVAASRADPHVLLVTSDGEIALLTLEGDRLSVIKANLRGDSKLVGACVYRDASGKFATEWESEDSMPSQSSKPRAGLGSSTTSSSSAAVEDEDALLYGGGASSSGAAAAASSQDSSSGVAAFWRRHLRRAQVPSTYWAALLRQDGSLEILSLPDFTVRFAVADFRLVPDVLVDSKAASAADVSTVQSPAVTEILLVGLGASGRRPILLARTEDHELAAYEAFPHPGGGSPEQAGRERLKLRFKKMRHGLILRERKGKSKKDLMKAPRASLRPFTDIAGYDGVFVCGPYPHWLMLTARGELRCHPMPVDGSVPCFAPFHNVNCPSGFLYFNRRGELRICVLPTHLSYDAPWPVRKVPLRCTPHFVTYHLESKTYAVVTSTSEPTDKVWKFNGDDKELVTEERDASRFPWPNKDTFHVQLFSPVSWDPIPGTSTKLEDWERCTGMKHLYLSSEGLHSGQRGYIVCRYRAP